MRNKVVYNNKQKNKVLKACIYSIVFYMTCPKFPLQYDVENFVYITEKNNILANACIDKKNIITNIWFFRT